MGERMNTIYALLFCIIPMEDKIQKPIIDYPTVQETSEQFYFMYSFMLNRVVEMQEYMIENKKYGPNIPNI